MQGILFIFISAVIPCLFSIETCEPQDLDFEYLDKFKFRYPPFFIEVKFKPCPGDLKEYYLWQIREDGRDLVQEERSRDILVDGYKFKMPNVYMATYYVDVNVSHNNDLSYSAFIRGTFKFKPRHMELKIAGGSKKYHPPLTKLLVDGLSLSKDASFSPKENPFDFNDVEWIIDPPLPVATDKFQVTVPWHFMENGAEFNFTMKVTRIEMNGEREVREVSQYVIVKDFKIAKIRIMCRRNCKQFNPKGMTVLSVSCLKDCEELTKDWQWTVNPGLDAAHLDFGTGFDKIVIQENSFEAGVSINVIVENGPAFAEFPISFFPEIERGHCDMSPSEGISGITVFRVDCYGFYSVAGISKYTVFQKFDKMEKGVILTEDDELNEKEIFLSEGNPATVYVEVRDKAYMQYMVSLSATVIPSNIDMKDIKILILGNNPYSVLSFLRKKSRNELAQTISFLLDSIEKARSKTPEEKRHLYHFMSKYLYILEPFDIASMLQVISVVEKMESMKDYTDTLTNRFLAKCTLNALKILHYIMAHPSEEIPPTFVLNDFLQTILNLVSNFVQEVPELKESLVTELEPHDYDSYDDMVQNRLQIRDNMRDVTESTLSTIQILGLCALRRDFPDQKRYLLESENVQFVSQKLRSSSVPEFLYFPEYSKARVFFSPFLREELENTLDYFEFQLCIFKLNLFWWHKNQSRFITNQIAFDIYKDGMQIVTLKEKIYFALFVKKTPEENYIGNVSGTVTQSHFQGIAAHRILVEPKSKILVHFNETADPFKAKGLDCHCSLEDFKNGLLIGPEHSLLDRVIRIDPYEGANAFYLCIQKLTSQDLNYSGQISSFSCLYWDMTIGDFVHQDSERFDLLPSSPLICASDHLSFFTGSLFIPPNYLNLNAPINFSLVLVENWVMVMIVFSLLLIWAILLFWACLKDRELRGKNFICKLDDNVPGDKHVYLVVVFTGIFIDAGTTADVGFKIIGEKSNSRAHLIKCCNTLLLRRNSQDWFIIYTPEFMGNLKKIRLWHNCKGKEPHWYCQRILVQHLESGTQYCFLVNEWLSLVWGPGKIYIEVLVKEETHLKSAKVLFAVKLETFKEEHLWLSVFTRAPQSNFSSIERVSTAMSVLFMSMLASAMFFGVPTNSASDSIDTQSTYFITIDTIIVFLESWLVAVPIGIIIILIFKHSSPHRRRHR